MNLKTKKVIAIIGLIMLGLAVLMARKWIPCSVEYLNTAFGIDLFSTDCIAKGTGLLLGGLVGGLSGVCVGWAIKTLMQKSKQLD